jgi:hypothetical protein
MKKILSVILIVVFASAVLQCCKKKSGPVQPQDSGDGNLPQPSLPNIQQFKTNPSDRFIVDVQTITAGHCFKGKRANTPHQGAHTHWDNTHNAWPQGGTLPSNYPVIYAVADGYINRIDYTFPVGSADRYGIDLAFAGNDSSVYFFCYGIEPMVPEPSVDFYKQFIRVTQGQHVKKGDTLAYMYLPASADIGCHIHFHIQQLNHNNFLAPAIFKSDVVDSFYTKWGRFANDGPTRMPSCMGYMLDADENPYGTGTVDTLK